MGLETGTYISDFVSSNPAHGDGLNQTDSHLRWIKSAVLATFPNITGVVNATQAQLNAMLTAVITGSTAITAWIGALGTPSYTFVGDTDTGLYSPGEDQVTLVTNGTAVMKAKANQTVEFTSTVTADGAYLGGTGQLGIIGEPRLWLADTLPSGNFAWLNGQAISRTTYPVLFALWGTKFGSGDGSTTFNIPNFQEVVPVGKKGMGGGTDPGLIAASGVNANIAVTGDIVGEGTHLLTQGEMPSHSHTGSGNVSDPGHTHTYAGFGAGGYNSGPNASGTTGTADTTTSNTTGITVPSLNINNTGGGGAHNIVQPGIVCNWITLLG